MLTEDSNNWKKSTTAVILAAGNGKRMNSDEPKPLKKICGKPIIQRMLEGIDKAGILDIIVVINPKDRLVFEKALSKIQNIHQRCLYVEQKEARGTGHALLQALDDLKKENTIVLLGDTPFIPPSVYEKTISGLKGATVISTVLENPMGAGRIIRDKNNTLEKIIEQKDLSINQTSICEINTGIMAFKTDLLKQNLKKINNQNASNEYYLTDIVEILKEKGVYVNVLKEKESWRVKGVNTSKELLDLENCFSAFTTQKLLGQGVEIKDTSSFHCFGDITCGKDVIIHPGVIIQGEVKIGDGSSIEAYSTLKDVNIGNNVSIRQFCVLKDSQIDDDSEVGPFAYCQGTIMKKSSTIGCFVQSKETILGINSKAKHLSYLGNLTLGDNCNVGAGVIHCNYDGHKKHRSLVDDGVFIGSNSALIAPIHIGNDAFIAAGSTITKNIPPDALAIARSHQKSIENWKKRKNEKMKKSAEAGKKTIKHH